MLNFYDLLNEGLKTNEVSFAEMQRMNFEESLRNAGLNNIETLVNNLFIHLENENIEREVVLDYICNECADTVNKVEISNSLFNFFKNELKDEDENYIYDIINNLYIKKRRR